MVAQALETQERGSSMRKKVAVIILNWNGAKMLAQFLPSVVRYSQLEGVAVYVADNGSTDDSIEVVEQLFPSVQLLVFSQNYGFAEGYNKAISAIDAEYVVLLNSDVEVAPNWLSPMIDYMDAHPEVAACQPKIRSWRSKAYFEYAGACGGFIDPYGYPFCRGRILNTIEKDDGQYDSVIPVFWATGAALFCRRDIYLEVGGLDARFFAHMEEIDLCWRMNARGHRIVVIPDSKVYHVGAATLSQSNPKKTFLNFRNNLVMIYKNLPEKDLKKVLLIRLILDYIAILVFILKGELQNAKAVWRARRAFREMKKMYSTTRLENLELTVQKPPGILSKSLIFQYYLKGVTKFSQLKQTND